MRACRDGYLDAEPRSAARDDGLAGLGRDLGSTSLGDKSRTTGRLPPRARGVLAVIVSLLAGNDDFFSSYDGQRYLPIYLTSLSIGLSFLSRVAVLAKAGPPPPPLLLGHRLPAAPASRARAPAPQLIVSSAEHLLGCTVRQLTLFRAATRFTNSKSISSDQFFDRNDVSFNLL